MGKRVRERAFYNGEGKNDDKREVGRLVRFSFYDSERVEGRSFRCRVDNVEKSPRWTRDKGREVKMDGPWIDGEEGGEGRKDDGYESVRSEEGK